MSAEPQAKSLWADLADSIRGVDRDFTQGPISKAVLLLSVPMVLEMVLESVFAVVDVFFVARLGPGPVAVVGITESVLTIVFATAIGLSAAATAMVARRIGEKDREAAAVAATQALVAGVTAAALTGILGVIFAEDVLRLMGLEESLIAGGVTYTRVLFGGSGTIYMLFLINAVFRGAGDASLAMRSLWLANAINLILDPCLIFGLGPFPELGLTGASVATTIGRSCGVAFQLWLLTSGRGRIHLERRHLRVEPQILLRLLRVSATGILQYLIATASWLGLMRILATFGSAALAGYTVAIRIVIFALLPSWGLSNAAATLVGQNLGAGKPERAVRSVRLAAIYDAIFLGFVGLVFLLFTESLVGIFLDEPSAAAYGAETLRYLAYGFPFYAVGMVYVQAFNGAGDTVTPSVINFFCYWLWQIPLAYTLALVMDFGPTGVFAAIPIAEITLTIAAFALFRRGRWQEKVI